jgi:hypothetical protein
MCKTSLQSVGRVEQDERSLPSSSGLYLPELESNAVFFYTKSKCALKSVGTRYRWLPIFVPLIQNGE